MKVLLGLAGEDDSMQVLERTASRAVAADDELVVAIGGVDVTDADTDLESSVREMLEQYDIEASVRTLDGDLGSRLVEIAERESFDQIVLEGGTRSPMGKISISNTAEFVLLNARTTVTLVR